MRAKAMVFVLTVGLPLAAVALMAGGAQANGGQAITDPVVIANDDATLAGMGDFYEVRGRVDSSTDLVADGVANGAAVSVFQSSSRGRAFPGYAEIDSATFDASECKAVKAGLSLYCKGTASGSFLRLRGTRARPGSWRVRALVRGRNFDPGKPFGTPLAAEVDLGGASGAFLGVTASCRLSNNGARYTCRGEGVAPTPTPTPDVTPTPTPEPTPTPCSPITVDNGKLGNYTDNCDGTVTDSTSGLVWEKKTGAVGPDVICTTPSSCPDPHDVNNRYTWTATSSPYPFDGTAKTEFLDRLNCQGAYTSGCTPWLGHNDWRLPTIIELSGQDTFGPATGGIVDLTAPGCGDDTVPCINPIFGPTRSRYGREDFYWSSSPTFEPNSTMVVTFYRGSVTDFGKESHEFVRAVRSGS